MGLDREQIRYRDDHVDRALVWWARARRAKTSDERKAALESMRVRARYAALFDDALGKALDERDDAALVNRLRDLAYTGK